MRVLYLHQHFSTPAGMTGTRSHAQALALAARGHEVTVACGQYAGAVSGLDGPFRNGCRQGQVGPLRVVEYAIPCGNAQPLPARIAAFLRYAGRATTLALGGTWDLLVASSTPLTVVLPALAARRLRGTPFVFEMRDAWPELPRAMRIGSPAGWWAMERLADAACRQAAAVVALSDGMAATAAARGADVIEVLPNGCDLDLFGPQVAPWRPPELASDLPPGHLLAVYAGAHGVANGLAELLRAAVLLQAEAAPVTLLLVGAGAEKPGLLARVRDWGLGNVRFLDPLPKPRLAALLAGADIALHCLAPVPAFAELTSPNKLMDYLAAGLPVVANLGGAAARLLAGEAPRPPAGEVPRPLAGEMARPCGIATPPGDPAALAAAISALVDDPARRAALGAAGRRLAERRWDRRRLAARFAEVAEAAVRLGALAAAAVA